MQDLISTTELNNDLAKLLSLITTDASKPLQIDGNSFAGYVSGATPSGG